MNDPRGQAEPRTDRPIGSFAPLVEPATALTAEESERYSRHLLIPQIGAIGQRRLKNARVLVIGAGGLGSPVLLYLAAAGIGTLGIVEDDAVDLTNLQRQVIHRVSDIGRPKLDSAADAIAALNPLVRVRLHPVRLSVANALQLFAEYDLIVDGTDNFATRYLVNDAAAIAGKPYVWGSVLRFDGQLSVFWQQHGPTYRDLYPEAPTPGSVPSCGEGGVFGMLCGTVGALMVAEVVKLITGVGRSLLGRLTIVDSLESTMREVRIAYDPQRPWITELVDYEAFCGTEKLAATELSATELSATGPSATEPSASELPAAARRLISAAQLAHDLAARHRGEVAFDLIDVRQPGEYEIVRIAGSTLIPHDEILSAATHPLLAPDRDVVLYCKSGARSALISAELARRGFTRVSELRGGVLAWVEQIEPALPRY